MRPPSSYHSYDQFSVMSKLQKRRIYQHDNKMIKLLTTIPAVVFVFAAFVYGFIGWIGVAATLYTSSYVDLGVLGILDFLAFAAASAAISVQDGNRVVIPALFFIYIVFDTLFHMKFSVMLIAMLAYIVFASFKVARHITDINVLRQFEDFPFIDTSDDVKLGTFRNDDVVKALEKVAEKSIRDHVPEEKKPREEYTTRKW